jgi:putative transposase
MASIEKPGWHKRGYLPHFDTNCLLQHVVLSGKPNVNLATQPLAQLIEDTIRYHDGARYDLQAWCIMPDYFHVSLVFYPDQLMGKVIWTWKKWIVTHAKQFAEPADKIFELDYFDRFVRTLDQAEHLPGYIEHNPVKAGLVLDPANWRWSSAWHRARGWANKSENLPVFLPNGSR